MKVLIYSPSTGIWGGGQIYIDQLCRYLVDRGIDAQIASCEPDTFSTPAMAMPRVDSRWVRLKSARRLAKAWKQQGFTHILLNDLASIWLAPVFRSRGFQVSALLHLYLQKRGDNPLGHSWAEFHAIRFASRFCHRIFSVNKDNISSIGDQVRFVGNFVPDWFFKEIDDTAVKRQFDFLFVGRFAEEKNLPLFLRLLRNLEDHKGRTFNGLLVGDGYLKDKIQKEIEHYELAERVEIQPWVDRKHLPAVYDQGKVFIVSSLHEGFATTLLEAHARGMPAIVTRSSGFCAEFLEGYGAQTGLVFEPGEVDTVEFLDQVVRLVEQHESFSKMCVTKAGRFKEDNVLGPIANYLKEGA